MKADEFIRVSRIIFLMLIVVYFCPFAYGKIIYVDDDAIGANDGSSWADAYNYLQDAIATATAGDEIIVAKGIYKPDHGIAVTLGDNRASFHLKSGVAIKGGYAGFSAPDPNARNVDEYETILSGDLNGNDVYVNDPYYLLNERTRAENSSTVVECSNTDSTAVLDGLTITGGNFTVVTFGFGGDPVGGVGMLISSGSPTLIDCTFTDNAANNVGGGLLLHDNSNPTLLNCKFTRNYAEWGGGGIYSSLSGPTLINCTFHNNCARHKGGAMFNFRSNPELTDCTFTGNSIPDIPTGLYEGGGAMRNSNSNLVLNNCTFNGNTSSYGAGICNENNSNLILRNCTFRANIAEISGGGMLTNDSNDLRLIDCIFSGNSAKRSGGGISNGKSNTILVNCIFIGNSTVEDGGAVSVDSATFENCIFLGNRALGSDSSSGGAVHIQGSPVLDTIVTFNNCTFSKNWAELGCTVFFLGLGSTSINNCILWDSLNHIYIYYSSFENIRIFVRYSDIQGGWPGEGNIDDDPCFADPGYWADADDPNIVVEPNDPNAVWADGDYHLKSQAGRWDQVTGSWVVDDVTSPCIDAGDPNSPIGHEPFPNGGRINMGAYGGTVEASKSPSGQDALYGGGTGEPNNPYLIYTAEQMWNTGSISHHWDKHFKLMADINLGEHTPKSCRPIGSYNEHSVSTPFTGVFDGNGKRIVNFNYSSPGLDDVGLFGYVYGPMGQVVIKNLGLVDPNIDAINGRYVGALVGLLLDGTIEDCYVQGGSISGGDFTGGLVGACAQVSMMTQREIINCYCTSTISGKTYAGGLVGSYGGTITNCYFAGNIAGYEYVGGLLGESFNSEISNCYSTGRVLGIHLVGGLVGSMWGPDTVFRSTSSSSVIGFDQVGGLVGLNIYGETSNCYSTGSVSGISNVAGLVGVNQGIVSNCYSAGSVEGTTDVGGLVGSLNAHSFYPNGNVSNSFWDIETSGQTTSAGGTGLTTAEMQSAATFLDAGWDLMDETENGTENIWWILEGQNYPRLWWEPMLSF